MNAPELCRIRRRSLLGAVALLVTLPAVGAVAHRPPSPTEAEFATRLVIYDLAMLISPSVHKAREHCDSYCGDEGGNIEVAIGLLGIGGQATTQSLLNLLSVQLDGGGAEERECQIDKRGKALLPALRRLNASQLSSWCHQTFQDLRKRELSGVSDVSVKQVCRPVAEIEDDRKEWMSALQSARPHSGLC